MTIKKTLLTLASGALAATLITACGDDNTEIPFVQEPELNGRYTNENCVNVGVGSVGLSYQETLRFETPDKFTRYQDYFLNADCSGDPEGVAQAEGTYNVDNDGAPDSEGGAMEIMVDQAFVTAQSEGLADALSAINYCGVESYQAGQKEEVSPNNSDNLTCIVQSIPNTLYGVYSLNGDTLYLNDGGVSEMSESQEDRPSNLDQGTAYNKQ